MRIKSTQIFDEWLDDLKDRQGRGIILKHIDRMKLGNLGKVRNIQGNLFEKKSILVPVIDCILLIKTNN